MRIIDMPPSDLKSHIVDSFKPPDFIASEFDTWLEKMIAKEQSPHTMYAYSKTIVDFFNYIKKAPSDIGEQDIAAYSKYLREQGKSRSTIQAYLVRVGIFLKQIGNPIYVYGYIPSPKFTVPEYLTMEEVRKFVRAIDESVLYSWEKGLRFAVPRLKTLFTLLPDTGLRITEACNLTKEDIDFDERLIMVRFGKRGKFRQVPVSRDTLKMVQAYWEVREDNLPFAFEYRGDRKMDRVTAWKYTNRIAKKAGINIKTRTHGPNIHPHLFRHTFATENLKKLLKEGKGRMDALLILKEAMGHNDIRTTMRYLTIVGEDIRDMMGR